MLCTQCGAADAVASRGTAVAAFGGETKHLADEHFCTICWEAQKQADKRENERTQQKVREAFEDGSAFAQMRRDLEPLVLRGNADELAHAAEYLDLVATAQTVPLPDDLKQFADRHRAARASE